MPMKRLKKIKPSFWDRPDSGDSHPHQPLNFQHKWKLIVVFTSFMALLPVLVVTLVEYRLTRRIMESEMKNTMTGILEPAAESLLYALDRQTAVVDLMVTADRGRYLHSQEYIQEIQKEITAVSSNLTGISLVGNDGDGHDMGGDPAFCRSPRADANLLVEGVDKNRYLKFIPASEGAPAKLCVYLCYFPGEDGAFKLRLDLDMDFLAHFLIPYHPGVSGDIFVADSDGILVTPSVFFGGAGGKTPFNWTGRKDKTGSFEYTRQGGESLMTGYARIPNSSLLLVMVKSKQRITELWFNPRLKLAGYLVVSILLILLSIMGMATYLVGRIHAADRKRTKALHHAGYSNKMASIGRLASGVAHEINNPLAIINEKTGLMLDLIALEKNASPNERLSTLANDVLKAVERCGTVTRRLMEFARNMDPSREAVDVEQALRWVMSFFRKEAKEQNIKLSLDTRGEAFQFNCDRGGLQQIFVNLFNNAFAAMERDGSLDILIRFRRRSAVEITVSDTGCGIPREDIHNIFEPFFTVNDNPSNTGLGLYVTFGIIRDMGGKIFVDSELGKGTTFKVVLPASVEPAPTGDPAIRDNNGKPDSKRDGDKP